jgi:hypothetical protein
MRFKVTGFAIAAALCLAAGPAQAQTAAPNVSGNYRCEPQPDACKSGQTFTLAQSGNSIDLRSERGEQGHANLTSPSTISAGAPFNMLGVIRDGGIDWSNGTRWRKQ